MPIFLGSVRAVLAMSGSAVADWADQTNYIKTRLRDEAVVLGCPTNDSHASLLCIKNIPLAKIIAPRGHSSMVLVTNLVNKCYFCTCTVQYTNSTKLDRYVAVKSGGVGMSVMT